MNTIDLFRKGRPLWSWSVHPARPSVSQLVGGGLVYRYTAYRTGEKIRMAFTLFCEVGEPYKAAFSPFRSDFKVADQPVEYPMSPWLADTLEVDAQDGADSLLKN